MFLLATFCSKFRILFKSQIHVFGCFRPGDVTGCHGEDVKYESCNIQLRYIMQ